MLAEVSTTAISKAKTPKTFEENKNVAKEGGKIAKTARTNLEKQIGEFVVSTLNAHDKPALDIGINDIPLIEEYSRHIVTALHHILHRKPMVIESF